MLAKKFRLPVPEFYARKEKIETARGAHLVARWARTDLPISRFGVITRKQEEKSAAKRNRIRRAVFDAVYVSGAHQKKGYDILIGARAGLFRLSSRDIREEVGGVLKKLFGAS